MAIMLIGTVRARAIRNVLFILGFSAGGTSAWAANKNWIDAAGGVFSDGGNWSPAGAPGAADRAIFNLDGSYTVLFTTNPTNSRLRVGDDNVTFSLGGRTYALTSTTDVSLSVGGDVRIGGVDHGVLTLLNGTLSSVAGTIGTGVFGSGRITVGTGGLWNSSSLVILGAGTPGTLHVISGGDATSNSAAVGYDSTGTALISGSGSTWTVTDYLDIAGNANGSLTVENGGVVSSQESIIAAAGGVSGTATVTGAGSRWNFTGAMTLGENGNATLNATAGGFIFHNSYTAETRIANGSGAIATANINGGGWNSLGSLYVGYTGNATLNISNGGGVYTNGPTYVAWHPFATANVTVSGADSGWSTSNGMYIGGGAAAAGGTATVAITDAAEIQATPLKIWNTGTVTLDGGELSSSNLIIQGTFNWIAGFVNLGDLLVGAGGTFGANLALGANHRLSCSALTIGSSGPGTLAISNGGTLGCSTAVAAYNPGSTANIVVDGAESLWGIGSAPVWGRAGNANVQITGGAYVATSPVDNVTAVVGEFAGSTGTVVIDGVGSKLDMGAFGAPADFRIGKFGAGSVEVRNGGELLNYYSGVILGHQPAGRGTLTVRGEGSLWTVDTYEAVVGWLGEGQVNIVEGGDAVGSMYVGYLNAGSVTVDGTGSTLAGNLLVGYGDSGTLNVTGGGVVNVSNVSTTSFDTATASILVDGPGSALNCTGPNFGYLIVGGTAPTDLTVSNGATATALEMFVGDGSTAVGQVLVTGAGSRIIAEEELDLGFSGSGFMRVEAGASVESGFATIGYGYSSSGDGTVTGAGSRWTIGSDLWVGGATSGVLTIAAGGLVDVAQEVVIADTGIVELNQARLDSANVEVNAGTLAGRGLVTGAVENAGNVSPGNSAGLLTVDGNYTQTAAGRLLIEIGGPAPSTGYDRLSVTGGAALNGMLRVSLINGFVPQPGSRHEILTAGSVTGQFATVEFTNLPQGVEAEVVYEPTRVSVVVAGCNPCDTNCDGSVNSFDVQPFIDVVAGGSPCGSCAADTNGDGSVNQFDIQGFIECLGG